LNSLLRLIIDARGCQARLRELQAATTAAKKAQADLVTVRAEHDAFISREREDIAEQRKRLAKKEAELLGQEGNLEQVRENYRQRQAVLDRQLGRSLELVSPEDSGLTREFGGREHESPAPADPH
jgi:peptidoglycan hydrolase CwlO-like protein